MRAYRLCAARASSRPPARLRLRTTTLALAARRIVLPALVAGLCVPLTALADATAPVAPTAPQPQTSLANYGILGAVARPGVYQLPGGCTLGQLVRVAGGMTNNANGNARVLRGTRLAEQLFVAASESAVLAPSDLILVGAPPSRAAASNGVRDRQQPSSTFVQIGLLNLIDRPVVLTLPADAASPVRIVELLGQSPELVNDVGIVGPSRAEVRASFSVNFADDRLASGAVLIFPPHRVRLASLPPLPEPIVASAADLQAGAGTPSSALSPPASPSSIEAAAPAPPTTETVDAPDGSPPAGKSPHYMGGRASGLYFARGAVCRIPPARPSNPDAPSPQQLERMVYGPADLRGARGLPHFRNVSEDKWDREERLSRERAQSRPYAFFYVIGSTAILVMLFTIGSMSLRGLRSIRARRRETADDLMPLVPLFAELTPTSRALRVDANQPQTRLALDLAVFEQAQARRAQRATPLSDHTPKAA